MNPERRDEANATGVSLTRDTEAFELMRDSPGFERNQTVNNRGYRPSAHLCCRSQVPVPAVNPRRDPTAKLFNNTACGRAAHHRSLARINQHKP